MALRNWITRRIAEIGDLISSFDMERTQRVQLNGPRGKSRRPRTALDLAQLEDRVMLSAAPVAMLGSLAGIEAFSGEGLAWNDAIDTPLVTTPTAGDPAAIPGRGVAVESRHQATVRELVFIDTAAPDYQQLVDDLLADNNPQRSFEVVLLDADLDGVQQISAALAGYNDLSAVHVISHGTGGRAKLGSTWLTLDNVGAYAGQLVGWRDALAADADLLFYGCDLAANDDGQLLVESLSTLTNADVAASLDNTGHVSRGGDWDLEYSVGNIETMVAISSLSQQNWQGLLGAVTVDTAVDELDGDVSSIANLMITPGGTGISLREAITAANNDVGVTDTVNFNIGGGGAAEIAWQSLLPEITDTIVIDGTSQPGFVADPLIELDGTNGGFLSARLYFRAGSGGSTLRGVSITSNMDAIVLESDNNTIQGNWIGQNLLGNTETNFGHGIKVTSNGNVIGGLALGEANVIRASTGDGVSVTSAGATGNIISGNSIYGNSGLGIDLNNDGVTANDSAPDADTGANNLQNFAVLNSAVTDTAGQIRIQGTLDGNASTNFRIEFFSNVAADPSGYGEGQTYLGFANVMTDGSGNASFNANIAATVPAGHAISATATRLTGALAAVETSEFSASVTSVGNSGLWVSATNTAVTSAGTGAVTYNDGQIVRFTDPNLALGAGTTAGTFSQAFDIDTFTADGNADINGLHYVSHTVTVGTVNSVVLQPGDILLSTQASETLGGTGVTTRDVVLFRPISVGNYSAGTFSVLIRNPGNTGNNLRAFALVEQSMTVGGTALEAGDFLLVLSSNSYDKDVSLFRPTDLGTNPTGGTLTEFIDGASAGIGFDQQVHGLDFVQGATVVGGQALTAGQLLISINNGDNVGSNNLPVTEFDIFKLTVTATGTGTSSGTAAMLLRGSDVGLTAGGEEIDALALVNVYNVPPVITSDGGGTAAAVNVAENATAVTTVTATDADLPAQTLTYSIAGGADSAKFAINGSTGALAFVAAPDFETPTDVGTDNVYDVTVQVSDGTLTDTQAIAVTITPVTDDAPVITSDGGGASAAVNVTENTNAVTTVTATDADLPVETLTYSIIGGADAAKFSIDGSSGVLTFVSAPDFEAPTDAGTDNVYDVTVMTSDGTWNDSQAIAVTVVDVADSGQFLDLFGATFYNNSDGVEAWTSSWIESDAGGGGASSGYFNVSGGTLYTAAHNVGNNIYREVDLSNAVSATLSFSYINSLQNSASLVVQASGNGGGSYTPLAGLTFDEFSNPGSGTKSVDISSYLASNTRIRIYVTGSETGAGKYDFNFDNIQISYVANTAPSITSNGAGASASVNVAENLTAVTTVIAVDGDVPAQTLTYSIAGGADAATFAINGSSGALSFVAAPDFETPTDVGGDNVYDVIVQVSDGIASDTQAIAVTVTPVTDNSPTITSDGGGASAAINVAENTTAVTTVAATDADLPAETLTYSIIGGADAAQFAINGSTGALTFVAAPDFETPTDAGTNNVYDVTVQVSDGTLTDTQAIAVTVTPATDNAPVITSDGGGAIAAVNVAENTTAVTTVAATDADLPGETLIYSIAGGADAGKFAINGSTGALTFVAAPDFETPTDAGTDNVYDVTVQVSDGTLTDTQTIAVTVTPVDDNAPVITSDGGAASAVVNVAENATAVTTVAATDADLPAETLTYSIIGGADAAQFAINGSSGALTFVAAPDFETPTDVGTDNVYDLTVQVSDGTLTDTQTIAVTVTPITDNAPTITSDGGGASAAINVAENTTAVTTVAATDADLPAETLTYSIIGGADSAKFAINGSTGLLTFVVAPDFETPTDVGTDNVYDVTVQVSDGTLTDTQAIVVTVTPDTDNAPVITSDGGGAAAAVNVAENTTAVTTVAATDADLPAETLTYSIIGGVDSAKFAINGSSGALTFLAAPDYETPTDVGTNNVYDVTVQVSDGTLTDTQAIAVTVTPVTDNAPVITSDGGGAAAAVNVAENTTAVTTVAATDADLPAETLTYSIAGGVDSAKFAINGSTGALTFVAAPDFETPTDVGADNVYDVTVQVSDGTLTDTQAIVVTVTPITDNAPLITSDGGGASAAVNVAENATTVTTVAATDADLPAETLTYSIIGGADSTRFAINGSTGALTFVAAPDFETPTDVGTDNVYDVTVQVTDGTLTDTQAIAVTVSPVTDNAPVITSDGGGVSAAVNVAENTVAVTTVTATDADLPAETLTYSIIGGVDSAKFAINGSSGALTFLAAPDYETPTDVGTNNVYDVTVQVSDGTLTDTQAIAVTVTPVTDNAPVITSDGGGAAAAVNVAENTTAVTTVAATDADLPAETLTYSIAGGVDSAKFAINGSTGALTFVAAPDFETPTDVGADNVYDVNVQVSDGTLTDTQAIAVTVTPVTDNAPVITGDGGGAAAAVNVAENTTTVTTVAATDADLPAETLTYSIIGGADAVTFAINGSTGLLTFIAAPDFETPTDVGTDNVYDVTVQVSDGTLIDTQAIVVTVTPVDDNAPVITSDGGAASAAVNATENTTAVTTVTATDADLPAETLTYSIAGGADAAQFAINGSTGVLTFVAAPDFETPTDAGTDNVYDVTVQVSDGTLTDTQAIAVTVTPVTDNAPTITSDGGGASAAVNVAENATTVTTVAATDADLPAETLTYSILGGADAARFAINGSSGALTFVAAPDFETPTDVGTDNVYDVTVQVSDGTLTDTQTIAVTVTPITDNAPVITSDGGGAAAAVNATENTTAVTTVTATDADLPAETLTYSITGGVDSAKFAINGSTGALTFVAAPDFETPTDAGTDNVYDVTVQVSDGTLTDTQTIAVTVTPTGDNAPTITSDGGDAAAAVNVAENATAVTTVAATDADLPADTLTYSIIGGVDAAKFAINGSSGALTFVVAPDYETPTDVGTDNIYDVTVQVSDGTLTDTQAIAVTVTDMNETPSAIDDAFAVSEDAVLAVTPTLGLLTNDLDPEAGPLATVLVTGPVNGSLALNPDGSFTYTPNANFNGTDSFSYRATDGVNTSNVALVTINVSSVNDNPVGSSESYTVDNDATLNVAATGVLANDTDVEGDPLSAVLVSGPASGVLSLGSDGSFVYTPALSFSGTVAFTYQASDGTGTSNVVTVTIDVRATAGPAAPTPPPTNELPVENKSPADAESSAESESAKQSSQSLAPVSTPTTNEPRVENDSSEEKPPAKPAKPEAAARTDVSIIVASAEAESEAARNRSRASQNAEELARIDLGQGTVLVNPFFDTQMFWDRLNAFEHDVTSSTNSFLGMSAGHVAGATLAFTVGYVVWTIKGGYLMASFLSSLPAWQAMDPLPILDTGSTYKVPKKKSDPTPDDEPLY